MGSRTWRTLSAATVAAVAAGVLGATPQAQADPDAVAKAQRELARIEAESSAIDARYIELQSQLDEATRTLGSATRDLTGQRAKVGELSRDLGQFAMLRYQTSGVDMTTTLLTSDDEADFLNQLATIQSVTDRANERVQELQLAQADLAEAQQQAARARARIAADKADQARTAQAYHRKQAEAQAVLERLTAEEKARLAEIERKAEAERRARAAEAIAAARRAQQEADREQAARESAAQAERDRAAREPSSPAPSGQPDQGAANADDQGSGNQDSAAATGDGRASTAVGAALAQVGKSYVMGATGPSAYDCSGLMLRSWGTAGVSLPRTSQAQYGAGTAVPRSELRPGDLVFYYPGISHVGMYIGNGMIVHAANPRTGVKVSPLDSMPLVGARRVG